MKPFSLALAAFVYRLVRLTAACWVVALTVDHGPLSAQEAIARVDSSSASRLVTTGAELPSAYDAPAVFSRAHFASTTTLVEYKWGAGPILRNDPEHRPVVSPTKARKPNRRLRLDISPLFSVTGAAPRAQVFVVSRSYSIPAVNRSRPKRMLPPGTADPNPA